ncbi:MAG: DoxX family protein [Caulobacteraceae bacterium]
MKATASVWVGRVLSGLFALFIPGASAAPKLMGIPITDEIMTELGWPPGYVLPIGILELTLVLLYLYPRTSVLGAVLFMGLLGGAMATQIRAESPLFSHVLFSIYLGLFMWGGLWLRDPALQAVFPWRRKPAA